MSNASNFPRSQDDTRVTDWRDYGHYGYARYRIWQRFDGLRWFQRHEWLKDDGSVRMDDWISGASGWCPSAKPAVEQAAEAA